ncbi:hypothetical protein Scep_017270 [Stephania cephalantha]|uniref:Uncharacterized protein n=1 Tax=Stephania cephalantha TaxID=152367 RepID=A0AAP0IR34_9MAGN
MWRLRGGCLVGEEGLWRRVNVRAFKSKWNVMDFLGWLSAFSYLEADNPRALG